MNKIRQLFKLTKQIYSHPLNKGYGLKAVVDFFRYQIGIKILSKKIIVPWVDDSMFIVGKGESGMTGNLYTGFMEYEDMIFLLHALRSTMTFVDVGANLGAYTILASRVAKARTVAFEPIREVADKLLDQIKINRMEDLVDLRCMGVGDKSESLYFTNNNDAGNKVSIKGIAENTTEVVVTTLDSQLSLEDQLFLKIDVEGFELNVSRGAKNILASNNLIAVIIEFNSASSHEFGHSCEEVHQELLENKLIPVSYNPFLRKIERLNAYNKMGPNNTIYVKNMALVQRLCSEAPFRIVYTAHGKKI